MPIIKSITTRATSPPKTSSTKTGKSNTKITANTAAAAAGAAATTRKLQLCLPAFVATCAARMPANRKEHNTYKQALAAKSVPVTPVQPKSSLNYLPSSTERLYDGCCNNDTISQSYPNLSLELNDKTYAVASASYQLDDGETSPMAMITPPSPYATTPLNTQNKPHTQRHRKPNDKRTLLYEQREIFSMSSPVTPCNSSTAAAAAVARPSKLTVAAVAMFTAPQRITDLNRRWQRSRRNSSSSDSKEMDKLVLKSVDWDDSDIY